MGVRVPEAEAVGLEGQVEVSAMAEEGEELVAAAMGERAKYLVAATGA